ncbi:MAG: bifunctional diaminohydroxyphosphoribosylaminopyrimidine deaminase/5-amino-6-(5-phosphoribosylamino)uracil reductase RibD [Desulfobacterales bacterium]|nr:bifunctional diaminohydroxyphosphoribosylaminopyrimidine deaminase/5-amino-6-(5-phosphoribosylamino)uracil reductase RibD [Desulfobacterales bacterium]MDD4070908.1 bifunctional diaminohydroxyphosphoribosylaminopyrimidine deaminase/5-amino-6-(5-phosphoribosylamino)uracil reductase RibD [Desulfobacterales bacterium]MDD4393230.1 bifunctional diaminohydroxyphosphoribosylaminopyrimidine deaminase/5-amino-6-(5-phosphoribosylamino)uracil reductase RibD [Desulfobacterales bacterium]
MDDRFFMEMALDLAARGQGYVSPNPMVGAVVVKDGSIVGTGWHEAAGRHHAEVNAIDNAGDAAKGATLYVTLEPCNHTGRTPPCTRKIIQVGIKRVVVAMTDPNPGVTGGGIDRLRASGIDVTIGICEDKARRLNESFVKYVTTGRPFVTLKCAATLDGRIATRTGDSRWVTEPEARAYVHKLRHACDAILVGIGTVRSDDPRLTTRLDGEKGRDPIRVILDSRLSIPRTSNVLNLKSDSDTVIVTGGHVPEHRRREIEKAGIRIIECAGGDDGIDLNALMDQLGRMQITRLMIEGGSRVSASALKAGIVDKVAFFYAPKILGGDDGVPICRGPGPALMSQCLQVTDVRLQRFGDDMLIEGYI